LLCLSIRLHHFPWVQHDLNVPCAKCQIRGSNSLSQSGLHYVPRLIERFRNNYFFFRGEVVSLTPNPQPGGPGYLLLSGPSPSTCPAWVALPIDDATAGTAVRIIWPRKPSHPALAFDKVQLPWRGTVLILSTINIIKIWAGIDFVSFMPKCCCT
jgi:hypothetical protein